MSQFELGTQSLKELEGVHPDLVVVVKRAIELTVQDFAVHDGLRTIDEQKKLVANGASVSLIFD
jgi:peptidoglycan L-alanyl-D-glutamate endopeptidase CwlK